MNHMNISILKSVIRIAACVILCLTSLGLAECKLNGNPISDLFVFALLFGIAEVLGILEEIFDKRKED